MQPHYKLRNLTLPNKRGSTYKFEFIRNRCDSEYEDFHVHSCWVGGGAKKPLFRREFFNTQQVIISYNLSPSNPNGQNTGTPMSTTATIRNMDKMPKTNNWCVWEFT